MAASAPVLDANNNIVTDANGNPVMTTLSAVDQYARTLHAAEGRLHSRPRSASWAAALRSSTSMPAIRTRASSQYDLGLFAQDDWRVRPNLTFSYGLRYEWQTNITDHGDFAPRIGFAWAPGSAKNGRQKTVIRGGFGMFYDRVNESSDRAGLAAQRRQPAFLHGHQSGHVPQRSLAGQPQPRAEQHLSPRSQPALRLPDAVRHRRGAAVAAQYHGRGDLHQHARAAHGADGAHQYAASRHLHSRPAQQRRAPLRPRRGQSLRVRIRRHACGRTS